jgi:hypothetical protein
MSAVGICKSTNNIAESRQFLRARCEVNGKNRDCRILEINPRAAFIESFVPAVTGSKVTLHFRLPNGHQVCTDGVVSHHQFKVGFGVDFVDLSARDRNEITSLAG